MKQFGNVFLIACKRIGKRPLTVLLLLIFPCLIMFLPKINRDAEDVHFQAGFVCDIPEKQFEEQFQKSCLECTDSFVTYQKYTTFEEMEKDLIKGKISCGFYLGEAFSEALETGDFQNSMELYIPEDMNYAGIVREDFTTHIYKVYSAICFSEKMMGTVTVDEIMNRFSEMTENGSVFQVQYTGEIEENIEGKVVSKEQTALFSLRGIVAFLLFSLSMIIAIDVSRDKKQGIGTGASARMSLLKMVAFLPIVWGCIFLFEAVFAEESLDSWASFAREAGCILIYGLILWMLAMILGLCCKESVLVGVIPCILLIGLLCTPVFFHFHEQIPLLDWIAKIYPVTWYLNLTV